MDHLLEILKILDGAVNADRAKVAAYAQQLASKLEKEGDTRSAESIRRVLRAAKAPDLAISQMKQPLPVDSESRLALADERVYSTEDVRVVLDEHTNQRIAEFLRHVRASDRLLNSGLGIAPSLLVHGPPGCGKTELAKRISAELQLPLLTARTDALVSSYLGSTSKNIRLLFEHAMARPCVLFLDELDAVGKLRDDQHELGELKRVVVSLLQNIDALDSNTVLLAATNHPHLLDRATWRRFAFRLELSLPNREVRGKILALFLADQIPHSLGVDHLADATEGMSGADLRQLCEDARRNAILDGEPTVSDQDLGIRLARSRIPHLDSLPLDERLRAVRGLSNKVFTVRRLAGMFQVSTGKVSALLNEEGAS